MLVGKNYVSRIYQNQAGGNSGGGGFFPNLMAKLPFGMSNVNVTPHNPNFPSKNQLDPKNSSTDPNNTPNQGGGEPNNNPNNNADPNKGAKGSSLDEYKDLFKLPTDDKGNVQLPADPFASPILNVDPTKLTAAAKQMNFASGVDAETAQKALQGDVAAFMQVINSVGQQAFLQATTVNAGVVERALGTHTERFEKALPDRVRSIQVGQMQPKHPALSHPAAAPMVEALKRQIAETNRHLSPEKVAEMAEGYVVAMATDINNVNQRQDDANNRKNAPQETDWAAMLGLPQG